MDPDLILHFIMALYDMDAAKGMTKDALKKPQKKMKLCGMNSRQKMLFRS